MKTALIVIALVCAILATLAGPAPAAAQATDPILGKSCMQVGTKTFRFNGTSWVEGQCGAAPAAPAPAASVYAAPAASVYAAPAAPASNAGCTPIGGGQMFCTGRGVVTGSAGASAPITSGAIAISGTTGTLGAPGQLIEVRDDGLYNQQVLPRPSLENIFRANTVDEAKAWIMQNGQNAVDAFGRAAKVAWVLVPDLPLRAWALHLFATTTAGSLLEGIILVGSGAVAVITTAIAIYAAVQFIKALIDPTYDTTCDVVCQIRAWLKP